MNWYLHRNNSNSFFPQPCLGLSIESTVAPQGLQKELHYPMARTKACSGCRSLSSTLSFTRDRARAGGDRSSPISTEDISHVCTQHHPMLKGSTQSAGGAQSAKLQIPGFLLCPRAVSQHLEGPNVIPAHGILQLCFPAGFETALFFRFPAFKSTYFPYQGVRLSYLISLYLWLNTSL